MIRAVCFDMDGVLVDSERLNLRLMSQALEEQGCRMTPEQSLRFIGCNLESLQQMLHQLFGTGVDIQRFRQTWMALTMESIRVHGLPLKPQARETLAALRQRGVALALCTSNLEGVVTEYLHRGGLDNAFDVVVTGERVASGKPDPAIYLLGSRLLGVPPEECAGVEDSLSGVQAVRAAGMLSVMIPDVRPFSPLHAPFVDRVLSSLAELENALWPTH